VSKANPQVTGDEDHERVHERVAAAGVAKDTGMVCTRLPHPSRPAARPKHGLDGQGADGRDPRAGPSAQPGRHRGRDAGVHESYL
jgi:hypothetical protein